MFHFYDLFLVGAAISLFGLIFVLRDEKSDTRSDKDKI